MNRRNFLSLGAAVAGFALVKPEANASVAVDGTRCIHLTISDYTALSADSKASVDSWLELHGFSKDNCTGVSFCDNGECSVYIYDRIHHVEVDHNIKVDPSALPLPFDEYWGGAR